MTFNEARVSRRCSRVIIASAFHRKIYWESFAVGTVVTIVPAFAGIVMVVVVTVVSVVSLLSLLLLGRTPTKSAPSSKFLARPNLRDDGQMSDEFFTFALANFCATPVVHTLASLLPVLLSLPVLQCLHLRSFSNTWTSRLSRISIRVRLIFVLRPIKRFVSDADESVVRVECDINLN